MTNVSRLYRLLVEEKGTFEGADREEWVDLTVSLDVVLGQAGRWLPGITALTFLPYLLIWGLPAWPAWPGFWQAVTGLLIGSVVAVVVYAVSAIVHEVLHLAAMILVGRVPPSTLRFGMRLSEGVLYVHSSRPMSARAYRFVLMLPAIALGLLPIIVGTLDRRGWMVVYGYVMFISAIGDLVMLQLMRRIDARSLVRDHPKEVGCQIRTDPPVR